MSRPAAGADSGDTPFGDRDTPFGSIDVPSAAGEQPVGSPDATPVGGDPGDGAHHDGAHGRRAHDDTPPRTPPPGHPDVPIIPDPPAPGTLPPPGVPFTGKERLRLDPGLRPTWLWIVLSIMAVGVVLIALGLWQSGGAIIGAGMIVGAVMRFSIPSSKVGLLRVRSRIFDCLWMLAIGIGIIAMIWARS